MQRPDKSVYRLTAAGRAPLAAWIEETPTPPDPDRNPLLLKIFFGDLVSDEVLAGHIRERRRQAERLCATLEDSGFEHGVGLVRDPEPRALVDDFIARHSG